MTRQEIGRLGEDLAVESFVAKGWEILKRNHYCRGGELDFVAMKDDMIAFVEVRARKRGGMLLPVETVTRQKCKKIIAAAYDYIYRNPQYENVCARFDLFLITTNGDDPKQWEWEHIENAFDLRVLE